MTARRTDPEDPHHDAHRRRKTGLFHNLRNSFLTGLIVVAPISLTLYIMWWSVGLIDSWVLNFVPRRFQPSTYIDIDIRGFGVLVFLAFTILVGWTTKGLIGRSLLRWSEWVVDRVPIVRSLYSGIKQIAETVLNQQDSKFDKACLIEYPRRGLWAIAFVSRDAKGEIDAKIAGEDRPWSVFLPTTPNPTSGFLLFVPRKDVIMLDMSVEDAAKLVISAGLVYPNAKDPTKPPPAQSEPRPAQAAE